MRASHRFWTSCTILLTVWFALANNAMAYVVSGSVANSTGKSGRIYLSVLGSGGGNMGLGVSIPAVGSYTIRGVPNGTFTVRAFMDTQLPAEGIRHGSDPVGLSATVTVNNADVSSGADITLQDPGPPVLQSPKSARGISGDRLAFVMWDPARTNDGAESARSYTVYWSSTPNPGPGNFQGKSAALPSMRDSGYLVSGLTNGGSYYFAVTASLAVGATESAPQNVNSGQPLVIGPPAGGHQVSGTLDSTGIAKNGANPTPLWVAVVVPGKQPVGFTYIQNPADLQSYTVAGVPAGSYNLYAILDMNNNGIIDAGDYMTSDRNAASITVGSSDLAGANFSLPPQPSDVSVRTSHWHNMNGQEAYSLGFECRGVRKLPVNVAVSGPQLTGSLDMAADQDGGGSFQSWLGVPTRPQVTPSADSYSFNIAYADGSSTGNTPLSAQVSGVVDAVATPVTPSGSITSGAPTFTWSAPPPTPPATPYFYSISVDGNVLHWESPQLPGSQLSASYGLDQGAPLLAPGTPYNWRMNVSDTMGNSSQGASLSFTLASVTAAAAGTYSYDAATGNLSLNWSSSTFVCQGPQVGVETKSVTTLSATTLSWTGSGDSRSWTRSSGSADIVGSWSATDSATQNSYTLTFNSDGTVSEAGTILQCGSTGTGTGSVQPTITGFTPQNGPVGSTVTITGNNFDPNPAKDTVQFNGVTATVSGATGNQLVATVPAGAANGPISVTTQGVTVHSASSFSVVTDGNPPAPAIAFNGATTDTSGQPVAGARVELSGNPSVAATSAADGSFALNGAPYGTPFSLKISMTGYLPVYSADMNSTTGITSTAPFTFYTQAEATGFGLVSGKGAIKSRVVDSANPSSGYLADAVLTAASSNHPAVPYPVLYFDGTNWGGSATFANGMYLVLGVDDGDKVTVTAGKAGWNFEPRTFQAHADAVSEGRIRGSTAASTAGGNLSASPMYIDFNTAVGGSFTSQTITFTNTGTGNLTIQSAQLTGDTSFSIQAGGPNPCPALPHTFAPGQVCTLVASFNPAGSGTHSASLAVSSDAANLAHLYIGMNGGIAAQAGGISGHVTNSSGAGMPYVNVQAYDAVSGNPQFSAATDSSGNYLLSGLQSGSYKVQFNYYQPGSSTAPGSSTTGTSPTGGTQLSIWYDKAADMANATPVNVAAPDSITGINAVFAVTPTAPGPQIAGFTPQSAQVQGVVTITGSGFGALAAGDSVYFSGMPATIVSWSDGLIVATVPSGARSGMLSVTANGLTGWSSSPFTVVAQPPTVTFTLPSQNATGMPVKGGVLVRFDKQMDGSSMNAQTFTLQDSSGASVAGTVSQRDNALAFLPAAPLAAGQSYSASLTTGIRSNDGAALAATYNLSFSTATATPATSFSLQNGVYDLRTSHDLGVTNYLYDLVRLAPDGTHLLDTWYVYQAGTGLWGTSSAPTGKDQYYALTDSGWQLASDAAIDGTVSSNPDGSFVWTNSSDGTSQRMEPVEYDLAGAPLASFANPADLPAPPVGSYPAGSKAYSMRSTNLTEVIRIFSWMGGTATTDQNYVSYTDGNGQQQTVTTLTDLPTLFATGQTTNYLSGVMNGGMQFGPNGTVQLFQWGAQGATPLPDTGSWEYKSAKGVQLLVVHLPQSYNSGQQGDLIYAAVNGVVKAGEWRSAGVAELDSGLNYNKTALDWMSQGGSSESAEPARVSAIPTALDFGAVPSGGSSEVRILTFSNQGSATATVQSFSLAGTDATSFQVSSAGPAPCPQLPASFAPGESCTVGVTFTPGSAGSKSATIGVAGADPTVPAVTVALSGAGAVPTVPGAPTVMNVAAGNGQATVGFTPPVSNGGAVISGYTVSSNPAGGVDLNAGKPDLVHNVTGLANGTPYTFTVTAVNAAGSGQPSAPSNSVTPGANPDPPTAVSATGGDGAATVAFSAPASNGGSAIILYTVTAVPGGFSATGSKSPVTVTGLANGNAYSFVVTATNARGSSAPSVPSSPVKVLSVPGAPGMLGALPNNGSATVSFSAPAVSGGSPITGYTVTSSPGNIKASAAAGPIVVTGLQNGTSYSFTVTASNAKGSGAVSAASNSVTPDLIPGAPTGVGALGNNGSATVSFAAPATNGGSAVTLYTVTSLPGNLSATGSASPITVSGLVNGTPYTFTVTASNARGSGPPSAPSNVATPDLIPGAPTGVSASHGNASTMVSFAPPAANGGSPVTLYTVNSAPGNISATGSASPITVAGLVNGTAYTFTVTAANAKGSGVPSAPSAPVIPSGDVPGAPVMGSVSAGDAAAVVNFTPPVLTGGSTITGYTVTSTPAGGVDSDAGTTATVHRITGLSNGTAYTFTVTATNNAGSGAASLVSNSVIPVTVPGTPTGVAASGDHAVALVSFSPPASDGGSAITRYTVTSTPGNISANGPASPITVTGLADGTSYTFTVTAVSAAGTGAASAPSNAVTPADTAAPVVRSFSVPGSAGVLNTASSTTLPVLSFLATDNAAVTGYLVTTTQAKPAPDAAGWSSSAPTGFEIGTIPGEHTLYAWAKDGAGNVSSPYSATVVVTPIDTTPPVILSGPTVTSLSNTTAVVEWQTDEAAQGGANYGDSFPLSLSAKENYFKTSHSVTLSNLAADTTYSLSVFATDHSGNGPALSKEISLRTKPAPDTFAPFIISGPTMIAIGPDAATVQWRTNEPAQGAVFYGTGDTLGQTVAETGFGTRHSVKLTGLTPQTAFYLKVSATDLAGNGPRESSMVLFKTAAIPDTIPPVIVQGPMVVNVSDTTATVLWSTDEPATGTVITYDGSNYGYFSDNTPTNAHAITLTGLQGASSYNYKVSSTDGSGNGMSMDGFKSFTTHAAPDTAAPVIIEGPLVVDVTYRSAAIRWGTDEPADSVIEYGTTDSFGSSESQSSLQRTHNLTLTGLEAGTAYYFRIGSTDSFGNGPTYSKVFTFTTEQEASYKVPIITVPPSVIYKTDTSMTIYWETDDPSDSAVEYGEAGQPTRRVCDSEEVTRHQITITNLTKNTAYKVVVSSTNMSGNTVYAKAGVQGRLLAFNLDSLYSDASGAISLGSVTTQAQADTTPPVITVAPTVIGSTDHQATISWITDEISDSQVNYGPQGGALSQSAGDPVQVTKHVVVLTNLSASTAYQFTVSSTDPSGNGPAASDLLNFTTAAAPDTTPPSFVGTPALVISFQDGTGKTTIGWSTDKPATTQIRYGTGADAMTSQAATSGLSLSHELTLALQPGTDYYAVAVAIDSSGNSSESAPLHFASMGTADVTEPSTSPSQAAGTYLGAQSVALTADKPAVIYYTIDGSDPSTSAPQYNGPISVQVTKTLKFFAIDSAGNREVPRIAQYVIQYPLSSSSADANGSISCPSAVNYGEKEVCTLTPKAGYQAASASGCGGTLSGSIFTTDTISGGCSVTASFTPLTFTVTPEPSANGTLSPAGAQAVNFGASSSFSVAPADGYQVVSVSGCGGTLSGSTYTTAAVSGNCTVSATFAANSALILGDLNDDGKVDIVDALRALRITVGLIKPTAWELAHGDVGPLVNDQPAPDGSIDIGDALLILEKSVGLMHW